MKIALIGYGKMGREIEKIALERGHEIALIVDVNNFNTFNAEQLKHVDVAIEFTMPEAAVRNYGICFDAKVPVVSGTTGWLNQWDEVVKMCNDGETAFFYASNYSLGVNLFFELNKVLAQLMAPFDQYKAEMIEVHHTQKLDAPSGTAITLAEDLIAQQPDLKKWVNNPTLATDELGIVSLREGAVPGIHSIKYHSEVDFIEITHSAYSRKGFALGAVLAAEFTAGKKGILSMKDLLKQSI
jgi:4-hydroxy-tetrahydrodipicolinate reductase